VSKALLPPTAGMNPSRIRPVMELIAKPVSEIGSVMVVRASN
jgi:hypothetical protein